MKKILLIALLFSSPAWAEEDKIAEYDIAQMKKELAYQQQQIDELSKHLGYVMDTQFQAQYQPASPIQQVPQPSQETSAQSWDRIHAESQLNEAKIQSENNAAEIYRMKHGY
jgi:hypothetical protein